MATGLPTYQITMIAGESLDVTIEVPVDYHPESGEGPMDDGSEFWVAFKLADALDDAHAVIRFATTNTTPPLMSKSAFVSEDAKVVLALRASADRCRQIASGAYIGDLIQSRPRGGMLGDQAARIARIELTIEPGTE